MFERSELQPRERVRHTEDKSPKYRMVDTMISTLRSFAVQTRILSKECNIIADVYVRSTAQDDVKFARHPELGATHVDTWVNVGGICNDYLKSFSGSINVDKRLRDKCAIVCIGENILSL